ncbi:MAG: hypothetical protein CK425_08210 [Parachlamydia sp.]|nr:MAG: hypothetical protein CK425_08210 [Parachlamydia sp.]
MGQCHSYCTNNAKRIMNLFNSLRFLRQVDSNILFYSTPLGNVWFNFIFNEHEILNVKPSKTEGFDKTIVSCWDLKECYVEFLRANFVPKIPSPMKVETSLAGIWRIKSRCKDLRVTLKVYLDSEFEGSPESGEGLISQAFESEKIKLSIGTEDEDYLCARARAQKWMPSRFHNILDSNAIEYISNGIQVVLPQLDQNDCIQIQFIIAWSENDLSSWFAVEQSADYILKSLDIT